MSKNCAPQSSSPFKPGRLGRIALLSAIPFLGQSALQAQQSFADRPMQPIYEDGAEFRRLNKPVLSSRSLDNMEDLAHWTFAGAGDLTVNETQVKEGNHSPRVHS